MCDGLGEKVNAGDNGGRRWQRQMQEDAMAKGNGKKSVEEWKKELEGLQELEKWEELLEAADSCIKEYPENAMGYFCKGYAKSKQEKHQEAIADFDEAIKFKPDFSEAYSNRGVAKEHLEQYREAIYDFDTAIKLNPKSVEAFHNRAIAIAKFDLQALREKYEERLKGIQTSYEEFSPVEIARIYGDEIEKIDTQLDDGDIEEQISDLHVVAKLLVRYRRFYSPLSLVLVFMFFASLYLKPPSCYEGIFSLCLAKSILYSQWFWLSLIVLFTSYKTQNIARIGLWTKARETAANLRLVFVLVFFSMTQIYFDVFGLEMLTITSDDDTINMLRYAASVIFIISPFIFYYRHINNRANQLHILRLSLHRERNNLLFWIAEKSDDINSPKFLLAKEILDRTNKNGAADIAVRMLHPKLDKERRWSWFGFGGNAFAELEDSIRDLSDEVKELSKQKSKILPKRGD